MRFPRCDCRGGFNLRASSTCECHTAGFHLWYTWRDKSALLKIKWYRASTLASILAISKTSRPCQRTSALICLRDGIATPSILESEVCGHCGCLAGREHLGEFTEALSSEHVSRCRPIRVLPEGDRKLPLVGIEGCHLRERSWAKGYVDKSAPKNQLSPV